MTSQPIIWQTIRAFMCARAQRARVPRSCTHVANTATNTLLHERLRQFDLFLDITPVLRPPKRLARARKYVPRVSNAFKEHMR